MKYLLVGLFLVLSNFPSTAQETIPKQPAFDSIQTIFQTLQEYHKIIIKTDLDSIQLNKREGSYQAATLLASGAGMPSIILPIQISARGKYRRVRCSMPPLKINFSKASLLEEGLYPTYDKLKLVTHCNEEAIAVSTLLKEFWVYKMYNSVTEESFQVHQFSITYVHTTNPQRKIKSQAFIMESIGELAHRLNGQVIDSLGLTIPALDPTAYHNVLLFNYMIGNTDWMIPQQKNIKYLQKNDQEQYTLIPYDFDYSAFVYPPYFKWTTIPNQPPDAYNRIAMNTYQDWVSFEGTCRQFASLKKTGFACFKNCSLLSLEEKKTMRQYLASFFLFLKNTKRVQAVFGGELVPSSESKK